MVKRMALALLAWLLLAVPAGAVSLEQVQCVMPEISVYVHEGEESLAALDLADVTATWDGQALRTEEMTQSQQGIFYVFMLDISRSMPASYLDAAKQAVRSTYARLRPQDQLSVIAFGSQITVLLQGGEPEETVEETLDALRPVDDTTRFYDALQVLVETAGAKTDMRNIAVVVSDGVDDTASGMTQEDLELVLRSSGVAVYALAVDTAGGDTLDTFGGFVRMTGGEMFPFSPADSQQRLDDLLNRIDEIWQLRFSAASNVADGQLHTLSVRLGRLGTLETSVRPEKWTPDGKAPYLVSLSADPAAGTIALLFSETMNGADSLEHYTLRHGDTALPLSQVSCQGAEVVLSAASLSADSDWTLEISGLTDASMEKNALPLCTVPLARNVNAAQEEPADAGKDDGFFSPALGLLACGAALLILAAVLLLRKRAARTADQTHRPGGGKQQSARFLFQESQAGPPIEDKRGDQKRDV